MQALLLATGELRKLPPLTADRPPAMLPVGHQPLMAHVIELLAVQGLKRQLVSLHYQPASIEAYFGSGQRWGVELEYVIQRDALGDAGAVKWAGRLVTQTCLVIPADVLADLDVEAVLLEHRRQGNLATQIVRPALAARLAHRSNGKHPTHTPAVTAGEWTGMFLLEPEALDFIPPATAFDIGRQLLPALLAAGARVGQFELTGYWNDITTLRQFQEAQHTYLSRLGGPETTRAPRYFPQPASVRGRRVEAGIWVGRNNAIHPSVRLAGPVFIGKNCRIGRGVELGPHVVIGANVIIDDDATISDSAIFDNTYVGKLVKIDQRVVAQNLMVDVVSGESLRVADAFLLGETPQTLTASIARRYRDALLAAGLGLLLLPWAVLWGLGVWLATGRALTRKSFVRPQRPAGPDGGPPPPLTVWHFNRCDANRWAAWLGRRQRQLEIERWPELWSVLIGDLALVGPKPLTTAETAAAQAAFGPGRRDDEPGFTGLWYVQADRRSPLDEVVIADAYYAATRSWREDMRILARTPEAWLRRVRQTVAGDRLN